MRRGKICVGIAALMALATACGSSGHAASAKSRSSTTQANQTLHVVVATLPQYLGDPFQAVAQPRAETTTAVFDALTRVQGTGAQPWLATSWTQPSPTTWNFTLRSGVQFSNGEPFDAQSVVTAVQALQAPAEKSAVANLYLTNVASASVVSPNVVQITTKTPDGILPQQVAALNPVPTAYWNKVGMSGFATAPVGTGPYKVVSLSTSQWVLQANPTSWRKPKIGHIVTTQLSDPTARLNAMLSGQDQMDLEAAINQRSQLKGAGFVTHVIGNEGVLTIQFINTAGSSPLSSPQVRQAINYAVNRPAMDASLYDGLTEPASQGVTPGVVGYDPAVKAYAYDPAKAKQLLAAAGYPNGLSFTAVVTTGAFTNDEQVFESAKSDLAAVGIKMTLDQVTTTQIVQDLLSGKWPGQGFSTAYQTAPEQDATKAYSTYSCLRTPGAWCDPAAAADLQNALQTPNGPARSAALDKLATEENSNPAALWLFNGLAITATGSHVAGYAEDQSDNVAWEDLSLAG